MAPWSACPSSSATPNGCGTSRRLIRNSARSHMPADVGALAAEVDVYIAATPLSAMSMSGGCGAHGTHQPGEVLTSAGAVEVVAPPVNDRRVDPDAGERARFCSAIPPPRGSVERGLRLPVGRRDR